MSRQKVNGILDGMKLFDNGCQNSDCQYQCVQFLKSHRLDINIA